MDRGTAEQIASKVLNVTKAGVSGHCRELEDDAGYYFWDPRRGGSAVIVAVDGSLLWANSGVRPDEHIASFLAGKRTDRSLFTDLASE